MSKVSIRAIAAAVLAFSAIGASAETMNMDVKAAVTGTCKMVAANALDFGTLDAVLAPLVNGNTTITYLCTKGKTPATFTIGGGAGSYSGSMVHATVVADTIPFNLSWSTTLPAGKGMGTGMEVAVAVSGTIAAGTYSNVSAGDYLKTLAVVLTP